VILLPFLDAKKLRAHFAEEKRRLAPEDAARNRFGPTYIYVPPDDVLAPELWQLAQSHATSDGFAMAKVVQPVVADRSVSLLVTPYPSPPRGSKRQPPSEALPVIVSNRVASAVLRLPPQKPQTSALLPCVERPEPFGITARETLPFAPPSSTPNHSLAGAPS
jgi:hypothetical protein